MQRKLNKIAKDTNLFLRRFIAKQKKSNLIVAMKYGLFSGGKKIRSKILIDVGSLFKLDYRTLIVIGAAVECIHAYSLIHDDLPCMDDDSIRRGKPSAHVKFGEATAVLAGNSLLTMAFEILSHKDLRISEKIKIDLISNHKLINYKEISEKEYSNQLSLQIHSPVMWSETIKTILNEDIHTFIEIGPKKTLLNFLPKDFQGEKYSFCSIEEINNV